MVLEIFKSSLFSVLADEFYMQNQAFCLRITVQWSSNKLYTPTKMSHSKSCSGQSFQKNNPLN